MLSARRKPPRFGGRQDGTKKVCSQAQSRAWFVQRARSAASRGVGLYLASQDLQEQSRWVSHLNTQGLRTNQVLFAVHPPRLHSELRLQARLHFMEKPIDAVLFTLGQDCLMQPCYLLQSPCPRDQHPVPSMVPAPLSWVSVIRAEGKEMTHFLNKMTNKGRWKQHGRSLTTRQHT